MYSERLHYSNYSNYSNLQEKNVFSGTTTLLWITVFSYESLIIISLRFLSVIAAVCYFSVYKLIGWDPENIYLSKVNSKTVEKGVNFFFFKCYLAAPRPTLSHSQGDSLINREHSNSNHNALTH